MLVITVAREVRLQEQQQADGDERQGEEVADAHGIVAPGAEHAGQATDRARQRAQQAGADQAPREHGHDRPERQVEADHGQRGRGDEQAGRDHELEDGHRQRARRGPGGDGRPAAREQEQRLQRSPLLAPTRGWPRPS